jgi:hypothetical protein
LHGIISIEGAALWIPTAWRRSEDLHKFKKGQKAASTNSKRLNDAFHGDTILPRSALEQNGSRAWKGISFSMKQDFTLTVKQFLVEIATIGLRGTPETEFVFLCHEIFQFRIKYSTRFAAFQVAANDSCT